MRTGSAALLPLLRSEVQGEVLALLLLRPDQRFSVTAIARIIGRPVQGVHREVSRLVDAGILTDSREGNLRYVAADTSGALYRPLADLMAVTYGPESVLRELLAGVEGVRDAYIYGSWAARRSGEPGPVPVDVDVLVVGSTSEDAIDEIADRAEKDLHRPVHIRRVTPADWDEAASSFLVEVKSRPLIPLRAD